MPRRERTTPRPIAVLRWYRRHSRAAGVRSRTTSVRTRVRSSRHGRGAAGPGRARPSLGRPRAPRPRTPWRETDVADTTREPLASWRRDRDQHDHGLGWERGIAGRTRAGARSAGERREEDRVEAIHGHVRCAGNALGASLVSGRVCSERGWWGATRELTEMLTREGEARIQAKRGAVLGCRARVVATHFVPHGTAVREQRGDIPRRPFLDRRASGWRQVHPQLPEQANRELLLGGEDVGERRGRGDGGSHVTGDDVRDPRIDRELAARALRQRANDEPAGTD